MRNTHIEVDDQVTIDAHDAMRLRNGDYILRTLLFHFEMDGRCWKVNAPNGEYINIVIVDFFKSIVKFEIVK